MRNNKVSLYHNYVSKAQQLFSNDDLFEALDCVNEDIVTNLLDVTEVFKITRVCVGLGQND